MCQTSWSISLWAKGLIFVAVALCLCACGFQLRGQDLVNSGYTYAVTGKGKDSQFAAALQQRLEAMNVLAGSVGSADITVELLRVRRQQVAVSYTHLTLPTITGV